MRAVPLLLGLLLIASCGRSGSAVSEGHPAPAAPEDSSQGTSSSKLQYFISGLADRDPHWRQYAIRELGKLKDPRAVPHLVKLLDSSYTWDKIFSKSSIKKITGIDPSTPEDQWRPIEAFKRDCSDWLKLHREGVERQIPPSTERWAHSAVPDLPGLGVSFAMTADQIQAKYVAEGLAVEHQDERRWEKNGHKFFSHESITARVSLMSELNDNLLEIHYRFMNHHLEEISVTLLGTDDESVEPLVEPLQLERDRGGWVGLGGAIRLYPGVGNAEKQTYELRIQFDRKSRR